MLSNYLIVTVRNLLKQKTFTLINVFGLSVGVGCSMVLGLYVHHQMSFDRHHPDSDRTYRVVQQGTGPAGGVSFTGYSAGALRSLLKNDIAGIRNSVRVMIRQSNIRIGDVTSYEQRFCLADQEVVEVFDLPLVRGDRLGALRTPRGILITESVALKFFGESDPVGTIIQDIGKFPGEYTISGVLKDLPETSLLQFDFLTSSRPDWPRPHWLGGSWDEWPAKGVGGGLQNFIVVDPGARLGDIEAQLVSLASQHWGEGTRPVRFHLQPIVRAHLYSKQDFGISGGRFFNTNGDIRRLYVAGLLGGFIFLLACTNFVNLSTARSSMRAREVGLRKTVGAHRSQIVHQFLGESICLSAVAHLFALPIAHLCLPRLSSWSGSALSTDQIGLWLLLLLPVSVLAIGLLAGSCPALIISGARPVAALKGELGKGQGGAVLRQGLVLFQFCISVLLIVGTQVVYNQWQFMVEKDPGYDQENVVTVAYPGGDRATVRQRFLDHPNVLYACVTNDSPVGAGTVSRVRPDGKTEDLRMRMFDLGESVLDVFGIEIVEGRDFDGTIQSDRTEAFILNESAARYLEWENPVGRAFQIPGWRRQGRIVGVVKDFHFESLHEEIKPLVLRWHSNASYLCLRVDSRNMAETMAFVRKTWQESIPGRSFEYQFLDQSLEAVYRSERKASQVFFAAAVLAIVIASMGLLGLASFSTDQRTKEIGIRKVLGATLTDILTLLNRDFIRLVALANLLMLPLSIFLTRMWLDEFAYRIEPGPWPFAFSAGLSLVIATMTVCMAAFQPANRDPVLALRGE